LHSCRAESLGVDNVDSSWGYLLQYLFITL
jgi:hypothetical protein